MGGLCGGKSRRMPRLCRLPPLTESDHTSKNHDEANASDNVCALTSRVYGPPLYCGKAEPNYYESDQADLSQSTPLPCARWRSFHGNPSALRAKCALCLRVPMPRPSSVRVPSLLLRQPQAARSSLRYLTQSSCDPDLSESRITISVQSV